MRLLIDENLSSRLCEQLRAKGHDVVGACEAELAGKDDAAVLAWAVAERRAVVTNNIHDFRLLHASYLTTSARHYGIVLVSSRRFSLSRAGLGALVNALDRLLISHRDEDLADREHFLAAGASMMA